MTQPLSNTRGARSPSQSFASPRGASDKETGVDLKQLKEELTCSICLEICIRPSTTPCGHSFCRRCLRHALRYSPKCPKCRGSLAPGFDLNVNTTLWNMIRMLFPATKEAPPSPPVSVSPIRRASDRHIRQILTAEAERLRNERNRASRDVQSAAYPHTGEAPSSRRRRRISTNGSYGIDSTSFVRSESSRANRMLSGMMSGGRAAAIRERLHPENRIHEAPQLPTDHHHTALPSSTSHELLTSSYSQTTNETRNHREDSNLQEMRSSAEATRRPLSRFRSAHGFGFANSINRSASHGDLRSNVDVEYVTVQRLQRVEQSPSQRHRGVYRFEHYNRDRLVQNHRRHQELEGFRVESSQGQVQDYDGRDFDTASDTVSDRDSSFTSSIAAPYPSVRANSFGFHEEIPSSPAAAGPTSESPAASFGGFERLYDISSQIEAAMNDIERLSLQPGWSRRGDSSQTPATPLTQRSCFQVSDEEDEEDDIDWNTRIHDAVFIVDDLDTDTETESEYEETSPLPMSPFHDMDESQWLSSVEESYY